MMQPGCKGCQSAAGPSGCPIHSGQSNELICSVCGYRGPSAGHGSCSTEPARLIARMRERVEKLESKVDLIHRVFHVSEAPKDGSGPVAPALSANGDLLHAVGEIVEAWRRLKAAEAENKKHEYDFSKDPALFKAVADAHGTLTGALDRLEAMTGVA